MKNYLFLITVPLILFGCSKNTGQKHENIWQTAVDRMADHPAHRYTYNSFWDNRFAKSTYADSADIIFNRMPTSSQGFSFYAGSPEYEQYFDGEQEWAIDHEKRKVITTSNNIISQDSQYYRSSMHFLADPKQLPAFDQIEMVWDTTLGGETLLAYRTTELTGTHSETGQQLMKDMVYLLDPVNASLRQISSIARSGGQITQVISYRFSNIEFSKKPYLLNVTDRLNSLGYRQISDAENEDERLAGLIKPHDQLDRPDYVDIDTKERLIFGKDGRKTVIMFSFIGCGGCEYALREMKKRDFTFRDELDFYYSSPVNNREGLAAYRDKRSYPFAFFAKDTKMNDIFKVAEFPTFVLIDEKGVVEDVFGGYDEVVEALLFE